VIDAEECDLIMPHEEQCIREEEPITPGQDRQPRPLAYEELKTDLLTETDQEKFQQLFIEEDALDCRWRTLLEQMVIITDLLQTPPRAPWHVVGSICGLTRGATQKHYVRSRATGGVGEDRKSASRPMAWRNQTTE
jgi:hypothetical protein